MGTHEFITPNDQALTNKYMAGFEKEDGDKFSQHEAGLAYDAMRLVIDAIKRGGADREGIRKALSETKAFMNLSGVEVGLTDLREPMLPIALGQWDKASKQIKLVKFIKDTALIDPKPWYQYYK